MEGGNLREGEALGVAKAVSPSRALPLLATPLFCVVVGVNVLTGCGIRGCREGEAVPICWVVDGKAARLWACSLGIGSVKNM